jgi:hypothetical protein
VKLCYGRGFETGLQKEEAGYTLRDTDFYGLNSALYDSEKLHVELQYQLGKNIFDAPSDGMVFTAPTGVNNTVMTVTSPVSRNLGDIHWLGGVVTTKLSNLNLFATAAASKTDPNAQTTMGGMAGLLTNGSSYEKNTGYAFYLGGRYDMATGTKIGVEYNHGTKNWIGMVPAGDDIWTSKLGTRGDVYEIYIIQSLNRKTIAKKGEAFIRLGYQLYDFEYTGSNSWIGGPSKISDLTVMSPQFLAPVKEAQDIYLTFDVRF